MVTATQEKLLTAEEFAELPNPPDGSQQELVRGVIITMPPPQLPHGFVCAKAARLVGNHCDDNNLGFVTANDAGVITARGPDTVRGPDVAFWSFKRLPSVPEKYAEVLPDLAIEVLSPGNTRRQIEAKIVEYLTGGSKMVWVIDPMDRTVSVYKPGPSELEGTILHSGSTLEGEDVLPGFRCPVSAFFPPLPPESA
jgi:Uma2 family endonuclease